MIPETILIHQERSAGGVLVALFHHSMSLTEAVKRGKMPPLKVFNNFMACGIDDVNAPCIEADPMAGPVLQWKPFKLTASEYQRFLRHLRKAGKRFRVVDYRTSDFSLWFTRCYRSRPRTRREPLRPRISKRPR